MQSNSKKWRIISAITGLSLFLIANCSNLFAGSSILAGMLQLLANAFVCIAWAKAYPRCHGFEKFVTSVGVIVPIIMAGITIWRVLLPAFT